MRMEWGNHLPRYCHRGGWVVRDAECLCRYLRMKIGRDCVGLGGAWAMWWKAWVRSSPNADYVQRTAPGDPMKYVNKDLCMV